MSELKGVERTVIRPSPGKRRSQRPAAPMDHGEYPNAVESHVHFLDFGGDNPLRDCAFSLFALVPKLRSLPIHNAPNILQERLIGELKNFEKHALQKGVAKNQIEISKYLLCSLLDETVLNTPWGSQSGWGHNSLSSLFFKKLVGGEEFFQILARLKEAPEQNQSLLEMAYMCLSLGFEGKYRYRNNGLITLERERQDIFLLIQKTPKNDRPELSIKWQGVSKFQNQLMRYVPLWVLAAVAGVLLMSTYVIIALTLRDTSDQLFDQLFAYGQSIEKEPAMQLVQPVVRQKPTLSLEVLFTNLLDEEIAQKKIALVDQTTLRIFDMFPSGSADIKSNYHPLMAKIAQALKDENFQLLVQGHTDNQRLKFSARYNSNWQLSSARAASAAHALARYGLDQGRITSEGMADKVPLAPNNTPANRALNRRIDIHFR